MIWFQFDSLLFRNGSDINEKKVAASSTPSVSASSTGTPSTPTPTTTSTTHVVVDNSNNSDDTKDSISVSNGSRVVVTNVQWPPFDLAIVNAFTNEAIGGIGIAMGSDISRGSAEIGYWLGPAYHSRGILTAVLPHFVGLVFTTYSHIYRLYASVFEPNRASAAVLTKCGFTFESTQKHAYIKHERLYDGHMYVYLRPLLS